MDRGALSSGETGASGRREILLSNQDKTHHGQESPNFEKTDIYPTTFVFLSCSSWPEIAKEHLRLQVLEFHPLAPILFGGDLFPKVRAKGLWGLVFQIQKCQRPDPKTAPAHD